MIQRVYVALGSNLAEPREQIQAALDAFEGGARAVVLATVGDPSVYSTFSYLRGTVAEALADIAFEVIPGITAMQAISAASDLPLVEGREILALVPATVGPERLDAVLDVADSVTIYKGGRTLPQVIAQLNAHDRNSVVGTDVSLPTQSQMCIRDRSRTALWICDHIQSTC